MNKLVEEMPVKEKNMLNCEEIFCLYLRQHAMVCNEKFYKALMKFVLLFRDCLNLWGWEKRAENESRDSRSKPEY